MIATDLSALRIWAMVLGFLIALLILLGGFAYLIGSTRHAQGAKPTTSTTTQPVEGRH